MKNLIIAAFMAVVVTASFAATKGHAEVTLDGKPIDLRKLTNEEIVTLANLIMKAAGK